MWRFSNSSMDHHGKQVDLVDTLPDVDICLKFYAVPSWPTSVTLRSRSQTLKFYAKFWVKVFFFLLSWDYESVWHNIWLQNKSRSLWPIFHGPVILSYTCILKTFDIWTPYFRIMSQYEPMFDLKIFVGDCDLCFMVQWFCLISWNLFSSWTSYFGIMSQYDPTSDLKIFVGHCGLYFMVH